MTDHQRPEALRAQFERQCRGLDLSRNEDGVYTDEFVYVAWIHYREGHAAAKAETAAAVAAERERLRRFGVELGRLATQIDADADASATGAEMRMVRQTSHRVENLALRFAAAIRAGAKELSDADQA